MGRESGFRLGRIRGIEIRVDWSLAFIFMLIVVNLGAGLFPARHPDWPAPLGWIVAVLAAVVFFASVLAHELAHALVGRRLGVSIDGITLFMFGGVARLRSEPGSPRAELLMAIAGPLASVAVGLASLLAGYALTPAGGGFSREAPGPDALIAAAGPVATLLLWLGPINLVLAIFNLLPGFPLDGGRVFRAILWRATGDFARATRWSAAVGRGLALCLMIVGAYMAFGNRVPFLGAGLVSGMWLVLIGWFLSSAAVRTVEELRMTELFGGVPVARLMRPNTIAVHPDARVEDVAQSFLLATDQRCLPVAQGDQLLGLVCLQDLRRIPRSEWALRSVREVMTPASALEVARPGDAVSDAVRKLGARDLDQLPVIEEGHLRGILRRADVLRYLELRSAT